MKSLGEARNKTLEALRSEKKNLNVKLEEDEVKINQLKEELATLKRSNVDRVAEYVNKPALDGKINFLKMNS